MGEPAPDEGGRGGGDIAQPPQCDPVGAGDIGTARGDGGLYLAPAQPVGGMVLVINFKVEKRVGQRSEGGQEPGGQTVGIDRNAQARAGARGQAQVAGQGLVQKGYIGGMAGQARAGLGRPGRLAADQSAVPACSSSARMRWEMAEGVRFSARAAPSNEPQAITSPRAASWAGSNISYA